jgi:hypothetical protein
MRGWWSFLLLAACGERVLEIPRPDWPEGATSYVVFFVAPDGEILAANANEPATRTVDLAAHFPASFADDTSATIVWYRESLAELELATGSFDPLTRPCEIERPIDVVRYVRLATPEVDWMTKVELGDPLKKRLRGDRCGRDLCLDFETRSIELVAANGGGVTMILPAPDGDMFVAANVYFRVDQTSATPVGPTLAPLPTQDGFIGDGRFGFAGSNDVGAVVFEGPWDWRFQSVSSTIVPSLHGRIGGFRRSPDGSRSLAISGPTTLAPSEVYELHEHRNGTWAKLHEGPVVGSPQTARLRIVWLDDDRALAVSGDKIWVYEDGVVRDAQGISGVTALAVHPRFGLLAGTLDGDGYAAPAADGPWTRVLGPGYAIEVVHAYADGFLIGRPNGVLEQYQPEGLPCDGGPAISQDVERIGEIDGKFLVGGGAPSGSDTNYVTWLTPK